MYIHYTHCTCTVLVLHVGSGGPRGGVKVQGGMGYEEEDSEAEGSESEESVSDDNPHQSRAG